MTYRFEMKKMLRYTVHGVVEVSNDSKTFTKKKFLGEVHRALGDIIAFQTATHDLSGRNKKYRC